MNVDRQADCHASGTVRAAAWAINEHRDLTLCAHHVGKLRTALEAQGWTIVPMTIHHKAEGVGTESTGQHFALETP